MSLSQSTAHCTTMTFCGCSGRIPDLAGRGFQLLVLPFGHLPPPLGGTLAAPRPAAPHRSVPLGLVAMPGDGGAGGA